MSTHFFNFLSILPFAQKCRHVLYILHKKRKSPEFFPLGGLAFCSVLEYQHFIDEIEQVKVGAGFDGLE